jgi:hypothetical protein
MAHARTYAGRLAAVAVGLVLSLPLGPVLAAPAGSDTQASPHAIRLSNATFRPGLGERPAIPPGLRISGYAQGQRGYYIVQFSGPVREEWKSAVEAEGAELLEYLPDFAFKARMNPGQARKVQAIDDVSWVGLFQPAFKLRPAMLAGEGEEYYRVRIHRGADAAAAQSQVRAAGAQPISKAGEVFLVRANADRLEALARILEIGWIERFDFAELHNEYASGIVKADVANASGYDGSGQTVAVADTGIGTGTPAGAHPGISPDRITIFDWLGEDNPLCWSLVNDGAHDPSSGHGTHVALSAVGAGNAAGVGEGTAPGADLIFQAVENLAYFPGIECLGVEPQYILTGIPYDIRELFQQAYDAGARIHSDSWGTNLNAGQYDIDSFYVDEFIWSNPEMTITYSAGNSGEDFDADGYVDIAVTAPPIEERYYVSTPATAKNLITVGASENDRQGNYDCDPIATTCNGMNELFWYGFAWPLQFDAGPIAGDLTAGNAEQMAGFSSRGPTHDNRLKPDIVAPGTWILSGYSDRYQQFYDPAPDPETGDWQSPGWFDPRDDEYKYAGGTSMSTPLVAGGAAVVRQYYQSAFGHDASAALVKATLINSAVDLLDENNDHEDDNDFPIPNNHEGWGRMDLNAATDGSHVYDDVAGGLATGGSTNYLYTVENAGSEFKVSLVWSDYPSSETAEVNLVNDLDLQVVGPGGETYKGNVFAGGWSQTGGSADRINNVENVYVQSAAAGSWSVTVSGYNIPNGPQPFALVVDGGAGSGPTDSWPSVSITNPTNGAAVSGTSVNITADATDDNGVDQVEFFVDGGSIGIDTNGADGWSVSWDITSVTDGDYTISATATDTALQTASDSIGVTVDNVDDPPSISITNPTDGATVSGTIDITADASDDRGVDHVEFFVDGSSIGTDTNGADGWSVSWDSTTMADGPYGISATATDTTSQTASDSIGITVVMPNDPPSVSITSPTSGATVIGILNITADASDDNGVDQVEFFVDGSSIGIDTNGANGWSVSWDSASVTDGAHTISATATDTASQTASDSIGVTVDNVDDPPSVSITSPADGSTVSGTFDITANASDDKGVDQVEFFVDGGSIGIDTNGADGWSVSWDSTSVTDGAYSISATATDTASQTASDGIGVTVVRPDDPPSVSITSPADGATVNGTLNITADASDDNDVVQVKFFVDGGSIGTDTNGADGWSIPWNSTWVTDGAHMITATAIDTASQAASDSIGVTVNNAGDAPSVSITSPADGATVSGTAVNITVDASDDDGVVDGWSIAWNSTWVADGAHTISATATATDAASQTASDSIGVTVNNVGDPPSVSITNPADGATVSGTAVNITVDASDDDGVVQVTFFVDGGNIGTDTNGADGWSIAWNSTSVTDGAHTISATATDTASQTASDSIGVTVDNVDGPPSVSITNPSDGGIVSGTAVNITADASDDVGVDQVEFFVDGGSIGIDTNGADGWSAVWDSTSVTDGAYTMSVTATDTASQTASDSIGITVNNVDDPPTVSITNPANGATVGGTFNITADASDDVGVDQVEFFVDGGSIGIDTNGADGWSVAWDSTSVTDGAHTISATATDTASQTASDSIGATIDNVDAPPSVSITSPADGATVNGTFNITVDASDDDGVVQVTFFVDGGNIGTDTNGADGWSIAWNSTSVTDGGHTISATATDTASQTGSDSIGVTVDNVGSPPSVSITNPADGATVGGTFNITADASDDNGVIQVTFFVDGGNIGTDTNGADGWSISWNSTWVTDGAHTISATATDTTSQSASDSIGVTVDNADDPPSVSITNPGNGATVSGTFDITANAGDDNGVDQVEFFVDGGSIGTDTNGADGWSVTWNSTSVTDGGHTISATATDTASQTASDSIGVTADNVDEPPSVSITNPADGATVNGTFNITANASDDVGVDQVEFFVDGGSIGIDTNGADGWSIAWNSTSVTDGAHTISATATDTTFQTASDSVGVTVDNVDELPSISITNPANGATVSGNVDITANAGDDDGVDQVEFFVDGGSIGTDTNGADGWSVAWDSTSVADGSHTISATATDSASQTASDSIGVTTDNVDELPSVSITSPAGGATVNGTFDITASASDDVGIDQVEFFVNGGSIGTDTNGADGWSVAWDSTSVADGSHTISATVTDTASQTASDSISVTVDNPDPPTASTVHVSDLDGASENAGKGSWSATVSIVVSQAGGDPAAGALVEGAWGGGASGGASCTTDGSGICQVSTTVRNKFPDASFTVSNVTHGDSTYDAAANTDPDTDSDGTTIVVLKDGGGTEPPPPPPTGDTMHIGDLDGSSASAPRNRWSATVEVEVHDQSDVPLANMTVNGSWSTGGSGSCSTGGNGRCSITRSNMKGNEGSTTFSVTDVTDASAAYAYDAAANHESDGDSTGTAITINQP